MLSDHGVDEIEAKVGEFEYKSTVDQTIGGTKTAMEEYWTRVNKAQPFHQVVDDRVSERPVQLELFVENQILQIASWT